MIGFLRPTSTGGGGCGLDVDDEGGADEGEPVAVQHGEEPRLPPPPVAFAPAPRCGAQLNSSV